MKRFRLKLSTKFILFNSVILAIALITTVAFVRHFEGNDTHFLFSILVVIGLLFILIM